MKIQYSLSYRIKRRINMFFESIYYTFKKQELNKLLRKKRTKQTIYLFVTPPHSNLGDQAQLMCWLKFFQEIYNNYEIICIPNKYSRPDTLNYIKSIIQTNDLIFIHSGYLIFDPHPELPFICKIVETFKNHPITILPQTINLQTDEKKKIVSKIFNSHSNLLIMCRDEISYHNAEILFPSCTTKLMPDIVTSLIGNKDFSYTENKKKGIIFCLRNDGEKFYADTQIQNLINRFSNAHISICDTSIQVFVNKWINHREEIIRSMLENFSKAQLIITDRYHGTIFSQIVNTPVIVLSSSDHKLSSGVKWFPKEYFSKNVFFAKDLEEAYRFATDILARNGKVFMNPPYFKEKYYNKDFNK